VDKGGIVTTIMNYQKDKGVSIIGEKLQAATEKALKDGKKK